MVMIRSRILEFKKFKKMFALILLGTLFLLMVQNFILRLMDIGGGGGGGDHKNLMSSFSSVMSMAKDTVTGTEKFLVNTPSCTIPVTKIMPEYYVKKWANKTFSKVPDCTEFKKFFSLVKLGHDEFAKFEKYSGKDCQLWEVLRHPDSDNKFKTNDLGLVDKTFVNVTSMEMFMVNCNGSWNYEATLPMQSTAADKILYWQYQQQEQQQKQQTKMKQPISILFFGTDTTSRSHAHRSIPKVIKMMKEELGFIEFQGFHAIDDTSYRNCLAFLMGLTRDQVRAICATDWSSAYDDCPMIWKLFGEHNYVTMFIEDSKGNFNWGGRDGFKKKPTDYYIKPLFRALHSKRDETDCFSSETVTQFEFRYLTRFLKKFDGTPNFSFSWLNYPFHDEDESLQTAEDDFLNFFSFIKSSKNILASTFIVYLGDHGDRFHLAGSDSIEGYVEKYLPALFIRIPDDLLAEHPELKLNAEINTKKLTTAFDVHHTFLHMLAFSGLDPSGGNDSSSNFSLSNFNPILEDRSSLLATIFDNRTCQSVNIAEDACRCNTTNDAKSLDNPYLVERIHDFLVDQLNKIVKESKYKDVCEHLEPEDVPNKPFAKVIEQTDQYTEVIFNFWTDEDSQFECQLRVLYDNSTGTETEVTVDGPKAPRFELTSNFSRVNRYGDQSWCVGYDSDEDKWMKNFCMCKEDKPIVETIMITTTTTTTTTEIMEETTEEEKDTEVGTST